VGILELFCRYLFPRFWPLLRAVWDSLEGKVLVITRVLRCEKFPFRKGGFLGEGPIWGQNKVVGISNIVGGMLQ